MAYCSSCGKEIADDAAFCTYCGKATNKGVDVSFHFHSSFGLCPEEVRLAELAMLLPVIGPIVRARRRGEKMTGRQKYISVMFGLMGGLLYGYLLYCICVAIVG